MKKVLLSEITSFLARGVAPKYTEKDDFYVLNQKCIRDWRVSLKDARFTDTEAKKVHDDRILRDNDILVNSTGQGTLGRVAQFLKLDRPATVDSHITIVRPNPDLVFPEYLGYVLKGRQNEIELLAEGSTGQTELSKLKLANLSIDLPPLDQQKKIADILGSLDEKIELNRRMNKTLEQLGQALFRHYFVDTPEAKKWKRGVVSDLGEVVTGKTPSKKNQKFFGDEVAFLKVPDMHKTSIVIKTSDNLSLIGAESQKAKYIPKWSTCVSCIATVGVVSLAGKNMQTNQQINSIVPRKPCFKFFNYFLMRHKSDYIKTLASSGSATPNLNMGHFSNIMVVMPDRELLKDFDTRVSHLFLQMENNLQENEILINIRDSLLLKLISGEIEV